MLVQEYETFGYLFTAAIDIAFFNTRDLVSIESGAEGKMFPLWS